MAYTPTTYVDGSAPPLSAANLNKSEAGIANVDGRLTTVEAKPIVAADTTGAAVGDLLAVTAVNVSNVATAFARVSAPMNPIVANLVFGS